MSYNIIYFDEAKQDVKEAKAYYQKQQKGLQKRFAVAIKKTIIRLQNNPTAFTIRYKNIRIAHSDVFPYGIHFYIDSKRKQIGIIAVIHNNRDSNTLLSRL